MRALFGPGGVACRSRFAIGGLHRRGDARITFMYTRVCHRIWFHCFVAPRRENENLKSEVGERKMSALSSLPRLSSTPLLSTSFGLQFSGESRRRGHEKECQKLRCWPMRRTCAGGRGGGGSPTLVATEKALALSAWAAFLSPSILPLRKVRVQSTKLGSELKSALYEWR